MDENGTSPAFPVMKEILELNPATDLYEAKFKPLGGLTKRELIAAMALQGLYGWDHNKGRILMDYTSRAYEAVLAADLLLIELAKGEKV